MPIPFSDPEVVFNRATRVWGWRRPRPDESFEQYREAFAQYVKLSDPEEAAALEAGAVFTKFDSRISVPTVITPDIKSKKRKKKK